MELGCALWDRFTCHDRHVSGALFGALVTSSSKPDRYSSHTKFGTIPGYASLHV